MSHSSEITERPVPPEPLRITNWPLRDERLSAWPMAISLLLASVVAGVAAGSLTMGLLTFTALTVSVWRLWIPVTFDFNSRGVVQTLLRRRWRVSWREIARYEVFAQGVILYADSQRTALAPLRSIYVRCSSDRDELIQVLEHFVDRKQSASISSTRTYRETQEKGLATWADEHHAN